MDVLKDDYMTHNFTRLDTVLASVIEQSNLIIINFFVDVETIVCTS